MQIVEYFTLETFDFLPEYQIVHNPDSSIRIEWDFFNLEDEEFERWAIIYFDRDTNVLFVDTEYSNFKFKIATFEQFFQLYLTDIKGFVEPLNKILHIDIYESIKYWDNIIFSYYTDNKITAEEYKNISNYIKDTFSIEAPAIVYKNLLQESPLLNSFFKNPVQLFPILYGFSFCTKFFLRYVMPILFDMIHVKKLIYEEI